MPVRLQTPRDLPALKPILERSRRGFTGPLGQQIAAIIRRGPGSVDEQFTRQALDSAIAGRRKWDAVHDFGNRPAPSSILQRTGETRRAWGGGHPASITDIKPTVVSIGVRRSLAKAVVHQHGATIRARRFTASGRPAMQIFLGRTYGVWIPARRLLQGLVIPPRPVGISSTVLRRASQAIAQHIATGGPR